MAELPSHRERRRPRLPTLRQPEAPATLRARVGARRLEEVGAVLELTDRTVVVEVGDAAIALALNLAPEVEVELDLGGAHHTVLARPGRRSSDIASSRRVELVMQLD